MRGNVNAQKKIEIDLNKYALKIKELQENEGDKQVKEEVREDRNEVKEEVVNGIIN